MQEGEGGDINVAVRVPVPSLDIPAEDVGRAPSFSASLRGHVVPVDALEKLPPKLQPFYRAQNERIAFYAAVDKLLEAEEREGRAAGSQQGCPSPDRLAPSEEGEAAGSEGAQDAAARLAVSFSALANIVLLVIKLVAAASSGSMAVIASAVDSVLDLLSGLILYLSSTLSAYVDKANFPVGKSRYEPVAVLLFACLMGSASFQIITEACQVLTDASRTPPSITPLTYGIISATVGLKAVLFLWCRALTHSSSCQALAMDHFNDVVTNSGTLAAILLSSHYPYLWFLDSAAAIFLAVAMLTVWSRAAREQMLLLVSQTATPDQISRLVYVALSHEPSKVKFVDTVFAYSLGNKLQVECDVVLDEGMPLKIAHDVGENLQRRLEALDDVERAFVHLDTEFEHSKAFEHRDPYL
jgi:cation diffusion facilitator family transporter